MHRIKGLILGPQSTHSPMIKNVAFEMCNGLLKDNYIKQIGIVEKPCHRLFVS
jgi:hypothetical protein